MLLGQNTTNKFKSFQQKIKDVGIQTLFTITIKILTLAMPQAKTIIHPQPPSGGWYLGLLTLVFNMTINLFNKFLKSSIRFYSTHTNYAQSLFIHQDNQQKFIVNCVSGHNFKFEFVLFLYYYFVFNKCCIEQNHYRSIQSDVKSKLTKKEFL